MFLLITFLSMAFLLRKAFCSWLCPVGTLSEYLWRAGQKAFKRNFPLPGWLDLPLRGLKYLLLGFFVWAIFTMSVEGIRDFMQSPYGLIADVTMLNFFRHIGETGLIVLGVFAAASVFVSNFWCRFLCPYGALLGLTSWMSPTKIRRDPVPCIDCAKCAKACPSSLPVDKLVSIKSVECTGCMECVAVCPAEGALYMGLPKLGAPDGRPRALPAWRWRRESPCSSSASPASRKPRGTGKRQFPRPFTSGSSQTPIRPRIQCQGDDYICPHNHRKRKPEANCQRRKVSAWLT